MGAMRDPMNWAIPLPLRLFGITVKVHLFFFVVTLGLFLRQVTQADNVVSWETILFVTVFLLFGLILLHEYGHCFAGRAVGGEASEVVIWPLGGLALVDVPQNWKAHTFTAAGGPLVNAVICLLTAATLVGFGYTPNLNPLANPYTAEMRNFRDGRTYTSAYGFKLYKKGTAEELSAPDIASKVGKPTELHEAVVKLPEAERALTPTPLVWVYRTFFLSWLLLLLNLLPAFPLDGGQILQGIIWGRSGFRQGTTIASYAGYVVGSLFIVGSIALNESLLMGLGLFILYSAWSRLQSLDAEESLYGDFSQGYLSLEQDDPPPRPKQPNLFKRAMTAWTARRIQRQMEQRQAEDERMDQLLDKIAKTGKDSLTEEEHRFMERVSARYRNRS